MTCIAAFLRPERIILGADSRVQSWDKYGQHFTTVRPKLHRAGKWFFVSGGYQVHPGAHGRIFAVIQRAIAPTQTITDAMTALARAVRPQLCSGFERLPAEASSKHIAWVGGVDDGQLVLGCWKAWRSDPGQPFNVFSQWGTSRHGLPRDPDGGLTHVASFVPDGSALRFSAYAQRPDWLHRGDAAAAHRLLRLDAAAAPDVVGPPYDVVEITTRGARRVPGEDVC